MSAEIATQERELLLASPEKNQLKFAGVSEGSETESENEVCEDNSDDDHQAGREKSCQSLTGFRKRTPEPRENKKFMHMHCNPLERIIIIQLIISSSTGGTADRAIEHREH